MGKINEIISPEVLKSIEDLNASFQKTDASYKKLVDDIVKGNVDLKNYKGSLDEVNKALDDASKILKEKEKINKQEEDSKRKLNQLNTEQAKRMAETKRKISEKNKEIQIEIVLNDKNAGTLEKLRASNKKLTAERNKLNLTTKEGQKRLVALNAELDKNNDVIRESSDAYTKQKINIGNYGSALEGLPGPIGNASRAAKGFGATLKKIASTNPLLLAITAIVAAIALLVGAFKKTQAGADSFKKVFAKVGAVIDAIIGRVAALANAVRLVLKGKFKEAGIEARAAFTGIRKEIKGAAKAAGALEDLKISIFEDETEFLKKSAERRRQIAELIQISKDESVSFREREAALRSANKLELANLNDQLRLQERRLQLAKDEIAATPERLRNREQERELAEQVAQLDELRRESSNRQRELSNRLIELANKERGEVAKIVNEQKRKTAEMKKQADEESKRISDIAKLEQDAFDALESDQETFDAWVLAQENKLQDELTKAHEKGLKDRLANTKDKNDEELELKRQTEQDAIEIGAIAANAAVNIYQNRLDAQSQELELQKKTELSLAGDNEKLREQIEEKFAKKQGEIRTKQAKADKLAALFNIAINTAQAILKITAQTGVGAPLAIPLVIATGLAQAAVVASQKIPKLAKGTKGRYDSPETFLAGEAGVEALESPGGKIIPVKEPTVFTNAAGYRVYSNPELERMTGGRMGYDDQMLRDEVRNGLARLGRKFDNIKTYKITPDGRMIGVEQNNYTKNYINRMTGN